MYRSAVQPKLPSSSLAVTPPTGHRPLGPPTCRSAPGRTAYRQPSWSSLPLRRMNLSESTSPRFASPGKFRPQGFAPSRRVTPRPDVRPYFRPVAPLGFSLFRGFPPLPGPADSSSHGIALVALLPLLPSLGLRARGVRRRCLELAQTYFRLQGLAPAVDPYRMQASFRAALRPIPS